MSVLATCDLSSEIAASKCFDCLSETEKTALKAWFLAQALKAFDGADLTDLRTLNAAVKCISCLSDFRLSSVEVAVYQTLASNAGADVNLPIDQLRNKIKCNPCGNQKMDRAAVVYLQCALALLSR